MFSTCMLCSHRLLCFCAMLMQAFSLCVLCSHIFVHAAVFTLTGCVCVCACVRACVHVCVAGHVHTGGLYVCHVHAGVLYVLCSCRRVVCAVFMQACRMCCVHAGVLYVLCSRRRVVFVIQGMEMKNVRWDGGGNLSGSSAKLTQGEVRLCEYMTSYYVSTQHKLDLCVTHILLLYTTQLDLCHTHTTSLHNTA